MKLLFSALFAAATLLAGLSADEDGQSRPGDVGSIISRSMFDEMFKHRDYFACTGKDIFTYDAFIAAAKSYPAFGDTGDEDTRRREIAAFLGQTSQETSGGWDTAPDDRYAWGYCFVEEINPPWNYCVQNSQWPCVPGKSYHGRGPIQLSYNYNYGQAEQSLGLDLLSNPELVAKDAIVSFKTAFWFWMTPQPPKPSCHDVITGQWTPTQADLAAGRVPGYGVITNIINGGEECGKGYGVPLQVGYRIGFYKRYCDMLGVTNIGDNLDCYYQRPFGQGSTLAMVTELKSFRSMSSLVN